MNKRWSSEENILGTYKRHKSFSSLNSESSVTTNEVINVTELAKDLDIACKLHKQLSEILDDNVLNGSVISFNLSVTSSYENREQDFDFNDEEVMDIEYNDVEVIDTAENNDVGQLFSKCEKYPGHVGFIPIENFSKTHLPPCCQDDELFDLIQAISSLTVRICVSSVSNQRPRFWPGCDKPYPFHGDGGCALRYGSGRVEQVIRQVPGVTCPCAKCRDSKNPRKTSFLVRVSTAAHVVFDDCEAQSTRCTLFYDSKDTTGVNIEGLRIQTKDLKADSCKLLCVTCDSTLADKIDSHIDTFVAAWEKAFDKYFGNAQFQDEKLAAIVHHPHGYFKHVSIGRWEEKIKYEHDEVTFRQYTYDTLTCPGSAGAYVLVLDFNDDDDC